MQVQHITPILNVSSIGASLAWFEKLGWKRCWTYNDGGGIEGAADRNAAGEANFAAVASGKCEVFLCRGAQGSRGGPLPQHAGQYAGRHAGDDEDSGGVWMTWWMKTVGDVDALHALALEQGITVTWPPTDEPWGVRECHIRHPDGHTFRVSCGEEE